MIGVTVRAAAYAVGVAVVLVACQPVDDLGGVEEPSAEEAGADEDRRGAPATGPPGTLDEALTRARGEAARWQEGATLAEIVTDLDAEGTLARARLTFLAADADRLLTVTVTADGVREERPTLAAFDLTPITGEGLGAVPPLPEDVQEPEALAAAAPAAFSTCAAEGAPDTVLYATGAPLAWRPDEQEWAGPLAWTATVTSAEGGGAVLDPVTAETLDCVDAPA